MTCSKKQDVDVSCRGRPLPQPLTKAPIQLSLLLSYFLGTIRTVLLKIPETSLHLKEHTHKHTYIHTDIHIHRHTHYYSLSSLHLKNPGISQSITNSFPGNGDGKIHIIIFS